MRTLPLLSSLLLAVLASCGGASTPQALVDEGVTALGSSDYTAASASLGKALATLQPGDPLYMKAKMALIETQIHLDAGQAKTSFLELAAASPDAVDEGDYRAIGSKMTSAKKFSEAIAVINAGVETYGKTDKFLALLTAIQAEATKAGDKGALSELDGLGYL